MGQYLHIGHLDCKRNRCCQARRHRAGRDFGNRSYIYHRGFFYRVPHSAVTFAAIYNNPPPHYAAGGCFSRHLQRAAR